MSCEVFVLPVPVAPATRPWRLSTLRGTCTGASADASPSTTAAPSLRTPPSKAYPERISSSWVASAGASVVWHSSHATGPRGRGPRGPGGSLRPEQAYSGRVIFKAVGDTRYPDHGLVSAKDWSNVPPRVVQLGELITTKSTLDLRGLLADDSTFFGDLFPHCVEWEGSSTSRTACTGPSAPHWLKDLFSTPASSYSPDTGSPDRSRESPRRVEETHEPGR